MEQQRPQQQKQQNQEQKGAKFHCQFAGCNRSYLRSEHLNRHALIRVDLLNAHLRRHEKRKSTAEGVEQPPGASDATPSVQTPVLTSPSPSPSASLAIASSSPSESKSSSATAEWHLDQNRFDGPVGQPPTTYNDLARPAVTHFPAMAPLTLPTPRTDPISHIFNHTSTNAQPTSTVHTPHGSMPPVNHLPQLISQQQSQPFLAIPAPFDDYPWLFHSTSLFDLPSDDYLNLHFGDTTDHTSPPDIYLPSVDSQSPRYEAPQITSFDHERLLNHCSDLVNSPLKDPIKTNHILRLALDYCDIYMPFFHRPTLNVSRLPSVLLLALCSLGAFLSKTHEFYELGKLLHKQIWALTVEVGVVLEHICTYAMARHEHEMSEIVHGIIVTLARRNNLMTESPSREGGARQALDVKWREWAQRESVISRQPLWDAPTATKWEEEMRQLKKTNRSRYFSLDSVVQSILSIKDAEHMREIVHWHSSPSPLSLQLLIHGIASAIGDAKYRSVSSSSSLVIRELQRLEFDSALAYWRDQFDQLPGPDQRRQLSWCALVMYDFAAVLLRNNLSDIQMAAGSAFSSGRTVTPQVAQAAYTRLVSTNPVCHDSYLHALEVVGLCLEDTSGNGGLGTPLSQPRPLWQTYCAFLGLLVLWARALGLENKEQSRVASKVGLRQFSPRLVPPTAATILANMHHREQAQFSAASVEVQVLKSELRELISTVSDRLSASSWEICKFISPVLSSSLYMWLT
ncbi:uncharacterized protein GIQ15_03077 [Arthroderma uncinatum]|uniref:uncharacterized protein n=1 Tax=Arthroderma uncinatum TaxID=74035 RepID=UPI00144A6E4C|nr:uncharacterized protein GIQ15_03077 [Arthroderma uncinatum]KAF3483753.1 hypothetical protein GIQ15_03077 [Arthroderma uncinatum]